MAMMDDKSQSKSVKCGSHSSYTAGFVEKENDKILIYFT